MVASPEIDGWIIAGGAASRIGSDKAALELGGVLLIDLAARALSSVAGNRISIAGEPRSFAQQYPAFPDNQAAGRGPMAGLVTALDHGTSEWIAVISCDMPFVTGDVFRKLEGALAPDSDAIVSTQPDGQPQPLCALYRRIPALNSARELLTGTDLSLRALLVRIRTHYVPFDTFRHLPNAGDLFLNINSPDDYQRAKELSQNRET